MKPRHMHVWRRLIVAASFVCFLLSCTAPVAFGQQNASDSFQHKVLEAKSAQIAQQAQAKFDGKLLYKTAFELLRDHHITLADQAARDKWAAEWETKFDKTGKLASEQGTDEAIRQMVASLGQRFDGYMDVQQVKDDQERTDATLVGIGVTIKLKDQDKLIQALPPNATKKQVEAAMKVSKDHPLMVDEPFEGGPAAGAGIKTGDRITKVDGKPVDGQTLTEVVSRIRGKADTEVTITVERADSTGTTSEVTYKVTRKQVVVKDATHKDLGNGIHYVKLRNFVSQFAMQEMAEALKQSAKGRALIIDLRGNGGGRLDYVIGMVGMLLPEGTVIAVEERDGDKLTERRTALHRDFVLRQQPNSNDPSKFDLSVGDRPDLLIPADMPIVVLVDEGSASASEILAGALQHHHRATVVGKTTYGKGVGQSVVNLPFGRKLRITSFEFLPGGARMDWIGIIPDVEVDQPKGSTNDEQLTRATSVADGLATAKAALDKKRDDTKQKNQDDFKKALQKKQGK